MVTGHIPIDFSNSVNVTILSLIMYGWSYQSISNVTIYALSAAVLRLPTYS
jgi:hypothetical protein